MEYYNWFRTPTPVAPMPRKLAKPLAGLAILVLLFAVAQVFIFDGWPRVAYVIAFGAMGLGNLALAIGSLLPEGSLSRFLLRAVPALVMIMMAGLGACLAFQVGCDS